MISNPKRKYLIFANKPLKSFYKKLFIGTDLGKALFTMSEDKALPKGLRDEDVERGGIKRPPVPYVPPVDPIQDSVKSKSSTTNFKITLPDNTIVYHAVYENGSNEAFVIHVQEVLNFCKKRLL